MAPLGCTHPDAFRVIGEMRCAPALNLALVLLSLPAPNPPGTSQSCLKKRWCRWNRSLSCQIKHLPLHNWEGLSQIPVLLYGKSRSTTELQEYRDIEGRPDPATQLVSTSSSYHLPNFLHHLVQLVLISTLRGYLQAPPYRQLDGRHPAYNWMNLNSNLTTAELWTKLTGILRLPVPSLYPNKCPYRQVCAVSARPFLLPEIAPPALPPLRMSHPTVPI